MNRKIFVSCIVLLILAEIGFSQVITIDPSARYQTIDGFGGFGPKKVWWDSAPYYDNGYLNQVIDSLGCTFIRTQIYWNSEPVNDDNDSSHFNWSGFHFSDPEDDNGKQLDFIRDLKLKGAKLIATVWTPPIWMKGLEEYYGTYNGSPLQRRPSADDLNKNCAWCGGASGCTQVGGRLKPEYYGEFAEYLAAYVRTVKNETGLDVYAINIQNEPMFPNPFESCVVPPAEYAEILKTVGARFHKEGFSTLLYGPEHMGEWSWGMNRDYVNEILADTSVNKYLDFYAVHSYVDGVAADYGSAEGWTTLHNEITVKYGKRLWMTETSDFNKTGFDLGFDMAKGLYLALKFGQISGWVYWYMADAMIQNNQLTKLGYAFKNFYRYISPGMVHVACSSSDKDILSIAFTSDTLATVILINNANTDKTAGIGFNNGSEASHFASYRTSASENCIRVNSFSANQVIVPAKSITTLMFHLSNSTNIKKTTARLLIYPNPTKGEIHINAQGRNFMLTDLTGRLVLSGKVEGATLDFSGVHNGLYFLMLSSLEGWVMNKLIIKN